MIKNLSQLKKALKTNPKLKIISHCRPECIGEIRQVTLANTAGFYSVIDGQPEHKISLANGGKGSVLYWSNAPFWSFENGVCSLYYSDTKRTDKDLIISFQVIDKEAA